MAVALKPALKMGKEGMGFDLCEELTSTWWTKAYSDSLHRLNVNVQKQPKGVDDDVDGPVISISIKSDDDANDDAEVDAKTPKNGARPMERMRRRMMKANFTEFSKVISIFNGFLIIFH